MLRLIFVLLILAVGGFFAAQGAFYGLLLYLWNAYFRPEEWTYGSFIYSLNLSLVIGAYVVLRTIIAVPRIRLGFRPLLLILFLGQCLIGTFSSEHPILSSNFLSDFVKVLLISYLIVVLVDDRPKFRLTLLVIALSLGFETAKQGWVTLFIAPGAQNNNTIAFLGDNNDVAVGTMMLVPVLGALAQTASTRWERYGHRFLAVGVFLRGVTTYSRGGFLAAAVVGIFAFLRSERKTWALIGVLGVGAIVYKVMPPEFWDRMQTITASAGDRDESAAGRVHFWQVAQVMAHAKPLTGVGLDGFEASYPRYNTDPRFDGNRAAHSIWFGVLGDLGYPGLILFVLNWGVGTWSSWRISRRARSDPSAPDLRAYANALLTSLLVFAVGGTFLSNQYNEMAWHFFALATALNLITERALSPAKAVSASPVALRPTG